MEVRPGYKQTEVGIIPEDWEVKPLGQLLRKSPSYGINAPSIAFNSRFPTYLRITDITEDGHFDEGTKASVDHVRSEGYVLQPGDVVFARTGASVGKSYLYDPKDELLVFAGFLIRVTPDPVRLDPSYFSFFAQSRPYWNWVKANSMRSGQPGINAREYASLPVPLPPTSFEQDAIATGLSDADAFIQSIEQLVAKKRQLKQGALQELLSGKTRLPGFTEEWQVKQLGELGFFLKGRGVTKDQARSGNLACVRYGELYTEHNDCIKAFHSWISPAVAAEATRLRPGDILFAGSGETKEEIGKCVAFVDDVEAYAGGDIVILRGVNGNAMFFGYCLNTAPINRQKASMGQGDAVVHISSGALANVRVATPSVPEQTAIAAVLSDMDREIAASEARLAKARELKQGMMQELLTGRIRLPTLTRPVASAQC